jgi:hypothetical protein
MPTCHLYYADCRLWRFFSYYPVCSNPGSCCLYLFHGKMATNVRFLSHYKITVLFPVMLLALNYCLWNMFQTESLSTQYCFMCWNSHYHSHAFKITSHADISTWAYQQHTVMHVSTLLPDGGIKWYWLCRHTMCPYLILGLPVFTLAARIHMRTVHFLLWQCCNC